jgi:antitoxin HicB
VTVRVHGRGYRAVLTPDLEVGGYTVEVPELPGCVTEGDDLAEAKRMAKDAIELWLTVAEPQRTRTRSRSG